MAKLPKLIGLAAVFDSLSENLGGFRERIDRHAFDATLRENPDVRAFVGHDADKVLGRTRAGTLQLQITPRGLRAEIDPPDTTVGRDTVENVRRGDVDQMSFAFRLREGGDTWDVVNGELRRTLLAVDLLEVSAVAMPAYPSTTLGVEGQPARAGVPNEVNLARLRLAASE